MRARVSWGQQEGRGFWWVCPVGAEAFRASRVILARGITHLDEQGNRELPGGPRGWIDGEIVSFEPLEPVVGEKT